jgi:hypothetical protein
MNVGVAAPDIEELILGIVGVVGDHRPKQAILVLERLTRGQGERWGRPGVRTNPRQLARSIWGYPRHF